MKVMKLLPISCVVLCLTQEVAASTGTIMSGYGAKNITMGGVSIALPYDSIAAANNPAGMGKVGSRVDFGIRVFRATAHNTFGSDFNENPVGLTTVFPEMGVNYQLDNLTTVGLSVYGGGLGAFYDKPIAPIPGLGKLENEIMQVSLAPTVTRRFGEGFYFSIAPTFTYSRVETKGVPGKANEKDSATGFGWRVGALWDVNEKLSLGATYTPRTKMGSWDKYRNDLFRASDGRLDLPEQIGAGLAYRPSDKVVVALDYMRIYWADVDFLNEKGGLGYRNQNVWRVGVAYDLNDRLTLRGGFSYSDSLARSQYTNGLFNGPAISNKSVGIGVSYKLNDGYELIGGIERHIPASLRGSGPSAGTNLDVNYGYFILGISKSL